MSLKLTGYYVIEVQLNPILWPPSKYDHPRNYLLDSQELPTKYFGPEFKLHVPQN